MDWIYPWKSACFDANTAGRDFVAGDIHGQYPVLEGGLENLGFDFTIDRLFCVGDLTDRGSHSVRVAEFLQYEWFHAIAGNHESMLLNCHADPALCELYWFPNGGGWWRDVDVQTQDVIVALVKSSLHALMTIETEHYRLGVVHALAPSRYSWPQCCKMIEHDRQLQEHVLWSRETGMFKRSHIKGIDRIMCGHTPRNRVAHFGNGINIDTGCGHRASAWIAEPALTIAELSPVPVFHRFPANF